MKRSLAIAAAILLAFAGVFAATALSGEHTNTASACTPTHTIADNGTILEVVGGDCVTATATATDSTTTLPGGTTTVTVTAPTTTTAPATTAVTTSPPPPACTQSLAPGGNVSTFFNALHPGDTGCLHGGSYAGSYTLSTSGTSTAPITLESYPGETATITGSGTGVTVNSNFVKLSGLLVDGPRYGFDVFGDSVEIANSTVKHAGFGVESELSSDAIYVHDNTFTDNNFEIVNDSAANNDYGAQAAEISGTNGLWTHNTCTGSWATSIDYGHDGSCFEVWRGSGNTISYNYARDNEAFSEIGHSSGSSSNNNKYLFNEIVSTLPFASTGIYQHGADSFGPSTGTLIYHNSIFNSAPSSNMMGCSPSCVSGAETIRDNAIKCTGTTNGVSWGPSTENYDDINGCGIWGGSVLGANSKTADPLFVSTTNLDTLVGSPARNAGTPLALSPDFAGVPVPQGVEDIGAFEH